jgi:hypothetical protein
MLERFLPERLGAPSSAASFSPLRFFFSAGVFAVRAGVLAERAGVLRRREGVGAINKITQRININDRNRIVLLLHYFLY